MGVLRAEGGKSGMMRLIYKCVTVIGLSVALFVLMEAFWGRPNCFDCRGYQYGFPFAFREEAGYVGPERTVWLGLLGNWAVTLAVSICAVWAWRRARSSK